jgi:hypothetical protein
MESMEKHRETKDIPLIVPPIHLVRDPEMSGGGDFYDIKNLNYYKNYFKQLYLATSDPNYKQYYKTIKNVIPPT